jgi:hypothetical protein
LCGGLVGGLLRGLAVQRGDFVQQAGQRRCQPRALGLTRRHQRGERAPETFCRGGRIDRFIGLGYETFLDDASIDLAA